MKVHTQRRAPRVRNVGCATDQPLAEGTSLGCPQGQTCTPFPLGHSLLWPRVNWSNWELTHPIHFILQIPVKGKLHHWEDPLCISVVPYQARRIESTRMPGSRSQGKHNPLTQISLPLFSKQVCHRSLPLDGDVWQPSRMGSSSWAVHRVKSDAAAAADLVIWC